MEVWGRSENPSKSGILSQPQKNLQRQFLGLHSNVVSSVTLHKPTSYIIHIHPQRSWTIRFFLVQHEPWNVAENFINVFLIDFLHKCVWFIYKHLVVNQIFTCFLLQNSNTAEMALKYGIFFRELNINFLHVTADCSVFIYNADVKH